MVSSVADLVSSVADLVSSVALIRLYNRILE